MMDLIMKSYFFEFTVLYTVFVVITPHIVKAIVSKYKKVIFILDFLCTRFLDICIAIIKYLDLAHAKIF